MEQHTLDGQGPGFGASRIPGGLAVSGTIDMATWTALAAVLEDVAAEARKGDVVLDLGEVQFVDTYGVRLIVDTARGLQPLRRLVVRRPPAAMRRIADILNLGREPRLVIEGLTGSTVEGPSADAPR